MCAGLALIRLTAFRSCGALQCSFLLFVLLDHLGLFLRRLGGPGGRKGWGEADEAQEDQKREHDLEQWLLPVDVHGQQKLGTVRLLSTLIGV